LPESLNDAGNRTEPADPGSVRQYLASVGVPTMAFDWTIEELSRGDGRLHARVLARPPAGAVVPWAPVLDAAMSIAPAAFPGEATLRMVAHVEEVYVVGEPPMSARIDITVDPARDDTVHVLIADQTGRVLARLAGLRYAAADRDRLVPTSPAQLVGELVWRPMPLPAGARSGDVARRIVLIGPDAEAAGALREQLTSAGAACTVLSDPAELDEISAGREPADVLLLPPSPASQVPITAAALHSAWLLTSTVQRLAARADTPAARLWCITAGVVESMSESDLAYSCLWGVGRIAAGEHPELWGGVIDLPAGGLGSSAGTLLQILRTAPEDDVIALRDGTATVPRLARPPAGPAASPVECRPEGTYLITGGLGALGLEVAHWLAERGARHIMLAGRREFPVRASWAEQADENLRRQIDGIRALEALGVTVRTVSLDIADAGQAARALSDDVLGLPPIRGVVHAAGVLDNRLISGLDEESLRTVMRPKVDGAWVLHKLFPPGSLDFLVLFSSCGYLLGLPGQASYGAANAFLDALAVHRRSTGHEETMSLGWTSWRGKGMAASEIVEMELRARGVTDISAAEAFGAWDLAAAHGGGYHAVLGVTGLTAGMRRLPLLGELPADDDADVPGTNGPDGLADLAPEELRERLLDEVARQVAAEMKLPVHELDPRRSLAEQGLDSVMTIVIRRRLEKRFARSLPATLIWHQPTVTAIAEYLAELLYAAQ
jgi:6-methylsalicylic acid synthase